MSCGQRRQPQPGSRFWALEETVLFTGIGRTQPRDSSGLGSSGKEGETMPDTVDEPWRTVSFTHRQRIGCRGMDVFFVWAVVHKDITVEIFRCKSVSDVIYPDSYNLLREAR